MKEPIYEKEKFIYSLPEIGFIRVREILIMIPVSKSTWWAGVKTGRFPKPIKLGDRMTVWRVEDIRDLIINLGKDKLNENIRKH